MELIAFVPLIVAIVGLLVYILASNGKLVELGRLTFFAGLLAFMFAVAKNVIHIG